jgi:hypothetical protein
MIVFELKNLSKQYLTSFKIFLNAINKGLIVELLKLVRGDRNQGVEETRINTSRDHLICKLNTSTTIVHEYMTILPSALVRVFTNQRDD